MDNDNEENKVDNQQKQTQQQYLTPGWCFAGAAYFVTVISGMHYNMVSVFLVEFEEHFDASAAELAILAGLSASLMDLSGMFASLLVHRFGCRAICMTLILVASTALLASAFVTDFYQIIILLGGFATFAGGSIGTPSQIAVQLRFTDKRALAGSISSTGYSLASLTTAPILRLCINHYGWRGAMIIMAGLNIQTLVAASLLNPGKRMKGTATEECVPKGSENGKYTQETYSGEDVKNGKSDILSNSDDSDKEFGYKAKEEGVQHKVIEEYEKSQHHSKSSACCGTVFHALGFYLMKNRAYALYLLSVLPSQFAIATYWMYGITRSIHQGLDKVTASFVGSALGFGSICGRLVAGFVGNLKCTNHIIQSGTSVLMFSVVTMASSIAGDTVWAQLLFAALFGFAFGGNDGLLITVVVDLVGKDNLPKAWSHINFMVGTPGFFILPLAGYLYTLTDGYSVPFIVMGAVSILGAINAYAAAFLARKHKPKDCKA